VVQLAVEGLFFWILAIPHGLSLHGMGQDMNNHYVEHLRGEKRAGIVFFKSTMVQTLADFYVRKLGCELWLVQPGVIILRFGSMLFGFTQSSRPQLEALISFNLESRAAVDLGYEVMKETALAPPQVTEQWGIYHFFAKDPEGRMIEFQCFDKPIEWNMTPDG